MKKYLLLLLLLISGVVSAQYPITGSKVRYYNGIGLSTRDTTGWGVADTSVVIMGADSVPYYRYKGYWRQLGGGGYGKVAYTDTAAMLSPYLRSFLGVKYTDTSAMLGHYFNMTASNALLALKVNISDTATMLSPYQRSFSAVKYSDTASMLSSYYNKTATDSKLALKLNISDTANMLSPYARTLALGGYVPYTGATNDLNLGTHNYYGNNYFDGFTSVAASTTPIVLTINSTPSYLVTGSGGQTIKLPDATTLPNGAVYSFNNNQTTGAISVNNNSNTLVKSVPSGAYLTLVLTDNTSAAGSWDAHFEAPSNVSWSTNTFDYSGSFTSGTWNGNVIAINRGGTGASTAAGALTNLGAVPTTRLISTTSPLQGGGDLSADRTLSITQAGTSTNGYLSSTDWNTFNSKQSTLTFNSPLVNTAGVISIPAATNLVSGYLSSTDWTSFNNKVNISDTATMLTPYLRSVSYGLTKSSQTVSADSSLLSTKLWRQKGIDSVSANVNLKVNISDTATMLSKYYNKTAADAKYALDVKYTDTSSMLSPYLRSLNASATYLTQTTAASTYYLQTNPAGYITSSAITGKVNYTDTATMLSAYYNKTATDAKVNLKVNISDTASMLSGYKTYYPRAALSFTAGSGAYNNSTGVITIPTNTNQLTNGAGFISSYTETDPIVKAINGIVKSNGTTISAASAGTDYQAPISLTTTGSSGASTFSSNTLNVPNYTLSGLGGQPQLSGTGFVKATGTTISYDNSTYLTTTTAGTTYVPYTSATGAVNLGTNTLASGAITSSGIITSSATNGQVIINRAAATNSNPLVLQTAAANDWFIGSSPLGTSTSDLSFYSYGTSSEVLKIAKSTGAATFSSSVTQSGFLDILGGNLSSTNGLHQWFNTSTNQAWIQAFQSGVDWRQINYNGAVHNFLINDVTTLYVSNSRNVGIGTISPNVSGQGTNKTILTVQGVGGQWGGVEIGATGITAAGSLNGFLGFTNASLSAGYNLISYIGSWLDGGGVTSGADMRFHTQPNGVAGPVERMRITSGGNVLIGTTTDNGSKLQVTGAATFSNSLSVNGSALTAGALSIQESSSLSSAIMMRNRNSTQQWNIAIDAVSVDDKYFAIIDNNASVVALKIANSTGAATFSSSVSSSNLFTTGYSGIGFAGYTSVALAVKGASTTSVDNAFIAYNSTASTVLLGVRNDGLVTIPASTASTSTSTGALVVTGGIGVGGASFFGSSVTATSFFESSDARLKNIIARNNDMVLFKWKPELKRDTKLHYGYIAQEVKKFMPDAVNKDDGGNLSVDYVQVHTLKINKLENEITELKKEIEELKKLIKK